MILDQSRREFIVTGVGYALAVSPVTAFALTTSGTGLKESNVTIPVGKEKLPAFLAMPVSGTNLPCVLVIQEIFGIHEYIKDVCRRLAKEGYIAIAPSLYFRQGDATKVAEIPKLISTIVSKVDQKQVWADLDATVAWLKLQKNANASKLAITGFCWGGAVTWMYSHHNPQVKAGVAWYGKVSGDATPTHGKFPLDIAADLKVPVLGLYGEKDSGIPLDKVELMKKSLAKGKSGSQIIVYTGAEHGFHADYRPSYHEKSAKDGWAKMIAWFRKYDVGSK